MAEDQKSQNGLATAAGKANQLWADFVPVIAFVLVYNVFRRVELFGGLINADTALFWATGVLIALTFGFLARQIIVGEPVSQMMVLSSAIVGGFGLIGILLQERAFIYVKPTIQQLFMAVMILAPMLFGKNLWKSLFSKVFDLPDFAWRTLAIRWALFFIAMALWNEFLWRTYVPAFEAPLVMAHLGPRIWKQQKGAGDAGRAQRGEQQGRVVGPDADIVQIVLDHFCEQAGDAGFIGEDLLGAQGQGGGLLRRQRERLVPGRGEHRLDPTQD